MSERKSRGIKCSRIKLDAALAASSISKKTQIALAEAVADAENLESVPKDLINKMFRQLPVDSQSIERVASVLGVDAQTLYLSGQEIVALSKSNIRSSKLSVLAIGIISIFVIIYVTLIQNVEPTECVKAVSLSSSSMNKLRIIVGRFKGDDNQRAQLMLASQLASNSKLNESIDVYTSCFSNNFNTKESIREQIETAHSQAKQELKDYQAHLILWGERYGNRLNIRFTSEEDSMALKNLLLSNKNIHVNELDFSLNLRMDDNQTISNDLPLLSLSMVSPKLDKLKSLKQRLIEKYSYSGHWLKEAVLSESNLLQRISPQTEPVLYKLTLTQLCYRQRLLGDLEASMSYYKQAELSCKDAIKYTDKERSPMQWATLTSNLAVTIIRQHLYIDQKNERLATLHKSRVLLESAKEIFTREASPVEAATYFQNFAAVYIRLAEFDSDNMIEHLETAMEYSQKGLQLTQPEDNPFSYAQKLQNQCSLKYRLGAMQEQAHLVESAAQDCQKAKNLINNKEHPRQWAMIQNNLAISHAILAEILANPEALNNALHSFDTAQTIYTRELYPGNWAEVEINKAELRCKLSIMVKDSTIMEKAKASAQSAQIIFVEKEIGAYQAYADNLISKIVQCDLDSFENCQCSQ